MAVGAESPFLSHGLDDMIDGRNDSGGMLPRAAKRKGGIAAARRPHTISDNHIRNSKPRIERPAKPGANYGIRPE
jgi:hypothetical protein